MYSPYLQPPQSQQQQQYQPQRFNQNINASSSKFTNDYLPGNRSQFQQSPYKGYQQNDTLTKTNQYNNDDYVGNSLRQGAQVSELEMILEGERRKNKEIRDKLEIELNNERKTRVDYENKLIRIKDDTQKKELYLSELEYRVGTLQQENQSFVGENQSIKDEILRMQELYNNKIRELEERINYLTRNNTALDSKYQQDQDQLKNNFEQEMEKLNKQWEFKYKSLEEKQRNLLQLKNEMENEIRSMSDQFMRLKVEAEEELRERVVRVQEEEYRKYQLSLKNVEQRLKTAEENKDNMIKKQQQLLRDLQEKDNMLNDQYIGFEQEITKFKQQIGELINNLNLANSQRDKSHAILAQSEMKYQRLEAEFLEFQRGTQRNKETLQRQIEEMSKEQVKEKRSFEDIIDQQSRKINELKIALKQMEENSERIRGEYDRLTNMLQNNIQRTISQTVQENVQFRPVEMPQRQVYKYE